MAKVKGLRQSGVNYLTNFEAVTILHQFVSLFNRIISLCYHGLSIEPVRALKLLETPRGAFVKWILLGFLFLEVRILTFFASEWIADKINL